MDSILFRYVSFRRGFDSEFEEETLLLFEKVNLGQIKCVYSDLTEKELSNAPENVRNFFRNLDNNNLERIEVTLEAYNLHRIILMLM
jgi:hypothetical protein